MRVSRSWRRWKPCSRARREPERHGAIRLGQQLPEVNVVVAAVLLLTVIPVGIATRLTGGGGVTRAAAAPAPRRGFGRGARVLGAGSGGAEPPGL